MTHRNCFQRKKDDIPFQPYYTKHINRSIAKFDNKTVGPSNERQLKIISCEN